MTSIYLSIPLRTIVTGSFSASSCTCAQTNPAADSAALAAPATASLSRSLRDVLICLFHSGLLVPFRPGASAGSAAFQSTLPAALATGKPWRPQPSPS
jgi:hypothetical protein